MNIERWLTEVHPVLVDDSVTFIDRIQESVSTDGSAFCAITAHAFREMHANAEKTDDDDDGGRAKFLKTMLNHMALTMHSNNERVVFRPCSKQLVYAAVRVLNRIRDPTNPLDAEHYVDSERSDDADLMSPSTTRIPFMVGNVDVSPYNDKYSRKSIRDLLHVIRLNERSGFSFYSERYTKMMKDKPEFTDGQAVSFLVGLMACQLFRLIYVGFVQGKRDAQAYADKHFPSSP